MIIISLFPSFLAPLFRTNKSSRVSRYIFVVLAFMFIIFLVLLLIKNNKLNKIATFSEKGTPTTTEIAGNTNFGYTGRDGITNLSSISNIPSNIPEFQNNQISIASVLNNL